MLAGQEQMEVARRPFRLLRNLKEKLRSGRSTLFTYTGWQECWSHLLKIFRHFQMPLGLYNFEAIRMHSCVISCSG